MPVSRLGQLITFAIETDADQHFENYAWVNLRVGDTVRKVAARRGHPELASTIAKMNGVRHVGTVLLHHPRRKRDRHRLKVPGTLRQGGSFSVLAGDGPPTITAGYAKSTVQDRPGRTGIAQFVGYDPMQMDIPVRFDVVSTDNTRSGPYGADLEAQIALLERMAGRGNFPGAATGPPAVIRISSTDSLGRVVPLIPKNYQWSSTNSHAPVWRISDIQWDNTVPDGVRRNAHGNRILQKATITVQQYKSISFKERSATTRSRGGKKNRPKPPQQGFALVPGGSITLGSSR
jgi:hypothetical protein